jgi:hypothetical protein
MGLDFRGGVGWDGVEGNDGNSSCNSNRGVIKR